MQKTIPGSKELGAKIKSRRNELGLTIAEAALRAGVGTKTWSRYEAGESIRKEKCKGICRALNWYGFPNKAGEEKDDLTEKYREHKAWSQFLAEGYGLGAAVSFAVGSDMLLDSITQDLEDLSSMPAGSHIGQLSASFLKDDLPVQFMMCYTYEFLYQMRCALIQLRMCAKTGAPVMARSVLQELLIFLCDEKAKAYMEVADGAFEFEKTCDSEEWVFDLFGDMDIVSFLYFDRYLEEDHPYHFVNWSKQTFYMDHEL